MSNALSRHLSAADYLDEVLMTSDTTIYRAVSGPGLDPDATGDTIHARVVGTGLTATLAAADLDTTATLARRITRMNAAYSFQVHGVIA